MIVVVAVAVTFLWFSSMLGHGRGVEGVQVDAVMNVTVLSCARIDAQLCKGSFATHSAVQGSFMTQNNT